jgi:hypothetical protein
VFKRGHAFEGNPPPVVPVDRVGTGAGVSATLDPMPVRVPVAALVLVLGLGVGVAAVTAGVGSTGQGSSRSGGSDSVARPAVATTDPARPESALAVLHAWDERRAAAWSTGDAAALARLYTPGSPARAADVALLRRYAARGLVVRGMRTQVLRARVLAARPRRLELEVTDRLAAAVAVRRGEPTTARRLPTDVATTRHLVLRRVRGQWLMAEVYAAVAPASASGR